MSTIPSLSVPTVGPTVPATRAVSCRGKGLAAAALVPARPRPARPAGRCDSACGAASNLGERRETAVGGRRTALPAASRLRNTQAGSRRR